jgi:hypothetical protein
LALARLLAIDWDQDQFYIVAAGTGRRGAAVEKVLSWKLDAEFGTAVGEALGRKLRDALNAADIAPAPIVACVGRDRVVAKELHYPPVPANEEPALVRFQAAKELSEQPDDVIIDYAHLSDPAQPGERHALTVALKKHLAAAWQALARGLGVKLLAVTTRSQALIGAVARAQADGRAPAGETLAILAVGGKWAELAVIHGSRMLLARSLALSPSLIGEVKRSLSVFASTNGVLPAPAALLVTGKSDPELESKLASELGMPVERLEAFAADEPIPARDRGLYAAALGAAQQWARTGTLPINFAAPKQPVQTADPGKRRKVIWAAAAAVLFAAGIFFGNRTLADRQAKIGELTAQKNDNEERFKKLIQDRLDNEALRDWEDTSVSWLDEVYDLAARFPHEVGFRVKDFVAGPISKRSPKDPYVAQATFTIVAKLNQDAQVAKLLTSINADKHLQASRAGSRDLGNGNQEIQIKVDFAKQRPDRYTTVLVRPPRLAVDPSMPMSESEDPGDDGDEKGEQP